MTPEAAAAVRRLRLAQVLIGTVLDHPDASWEQITGMAARRAAPSFGRTDPVEFHVIAGMPMADLLAGPRRS